MAYSELVTRRTRHMWRVHFFTKKWTRHKDCHTVKWTRHTVNSSHGDLVTLEAMWPSHTELVTVVTRTVTSTAPIYSHVADTSATRVCSLAARPRETDDLVHLKWFQDAGIEASSCARKLRLRLRFGTGLCRGLSCIYIITTFVVTSLCNAFTYHVLYDQWTRHTKSKIKKWTRHMWRFLRVTSSLVTIIIDLECSKLQVVTFEVQWITDELVQQCLAVRVELITLFELLKWQ